MEHSSGSTTVEQSLAENGLPYVRLSKADHGWFSRVALLLRNRGVPEHDVLRVLTDAGLALNGTSASQVHGRPIAYAKSFPRGSEPWREGRKRADAALPPRLLKQD